MPKRSSFLFSVSTTPWRVGQLLGNISMIREHLNEELHISAVLLTMYDARTKLAEQVASEVREQFGAVVLGNVIPRSVRVSEAPGYGKTVIQYDPTSTGARAYSAAARELNSPVIIAHTPPLAPLVLAQRFTRGIGRIIKHGRT